MTKAARLLTLVAVLAAPGLGQGIITTLDGSSVCSFSGDGGPATTATYCGMGLPTMDSAGAIYLVDNSRIRRIGTDGIINTIAGTGQTGASGDGGPALSATLTQGFIRQLAVYGSHVCFADAQELKIRCIDQSTGLIQGYGTGVSGTGGDGGNVANASFVTPSGLAFDTSGNMYISDFGANSVRRVDAVTGTITMFVGPGPGYCCVPVGDGGPALGADIYEPGRLTVSGGALYIADAGNDRIRRVDLTTGIITTVAGGGTSTADGVPAVSASISPGALILDPAGNLFLSSANTVRQVDTNGIITTIAGTGNSGFGLDDIPATQTNFGGITGLAWDPFANRLLIGDFEERLRQIFYTPATTTTLTITPNPAVPNGQVTLQATVSPQTATGSIRFYQDGVLSGQILGETLLGSVPLVNSTASLTWNTPLTGSSSCSFQVCDLRAVYSGDAADNLSTSPDVVVVLQKGDTSTTLTSTPNPSAQGQSVSFTATVTPSNVTGTFFVYNGATQIGSYPVSNGAATFTISNLPTGSNALSARYSGSFSYNSSTGTLTQVVQPATTTTLSSSPNPSVYGSAAVLTATVSPATATGNVQFFNGATLLGSAALASGQAQLTTTNLPTGSDSLTAVYSGDANDAGSTSSTLVQTVSQANSTTTLAANPSTATAGQTVTLTATVAPATATGTVQFLDGTTVLGTAPIAGGSASLATSTLSPGSHSISAVYSGDVNYTGSTSAGTSVTVSKVTTTTGLTASPNPATIGQAVTLSASVTPAAATGTVQFLDGGTVLGTVAVSGGTAALAVSTLTAGSHSVTATYGGDSLNAASTSAAVAIMINKVVSSVTLASAPNPSTVGMTVTLTAAVSPTSASGTVQFLNGATVVGSAALVNGSAQIAVTNLPAGSNSLTAVYSGDANDAGSTSTAIVQTVVKSNSTTALAGPTSPLNVGQSASFLATVTPASATGTVQFLDGALAIGTVAVSGGTAAFSTTALAAGSHSITAAYSGDGALNSSASAAVIVQIVKNATSTSLSSSPNPSVFAGLVTLTATVSAPQATGTVQFYDGAALLGAGTVVNGQAFLGVSTLTAGSHTLTSVYSGDPVFAGSTSPAVGQMVAKSASTTTISATPADQSTLGQTVTFTATVAPAAATGTVRFRDGGNTIGTAVVVNGVATFSTSALKSGSHTITARYLGDSNVNASVSARLTYVVKP